MAGSTQDKPLNERGDGVSDNDWIAAAARLQLAVYLRLDATGRITAAAGDSLDTLGYEPHELAGMEFSGFAMAGGHDSLVQRIRDIAGGEPESAVDAGDLIACPPQAGWRLGPDGAGGVVASCVRSPSPTIWPTESTLLELADTVPSRIAYVDRDLRYRFNNRAYEKSFNVRRDDLYGKHISAIIEPGSLDVLLPLYRRALAGEHVTYSDRIDVRDGRSLDLRIDYLPDTDGEGNVRGFFGVIQDVSAYTATIDLLKAVHAIVNRTASPTRSTLERLLRLGLDYLQLSIGLVARVEGERYIVDAVVSDVSGPEAGASFPVGNTYCAITLEAADVVATTEAAEDERISGHPCYSAFGLETYIGVPVHINGEAWGTVNFSAPERRDDTFSELDRELVRLIGDAVEHLVSERLERERHRRERRQLRRLAYRDALTGLGNRESLERKLDELSETREPYVVAVLDMDHFKAINDQWGHEAGDEVLRTVGDVIEACLRPEDFTARYGGEEFVIIMEGLVCEDRERVLERIRLAIGEQAISVGTRDEIHVSVSVGITASRSDDSPRDALRRADQALYRAKAAGRNRVESG
ncbi:diguanylate cyclase [Halofilum ochraceum]|uniref:diguanylate cyclase n=1 Tax=Halofilum ochraceum TaxID=1611323 RepID=UPI001585EE79|nr:diguanylate cyclase [Halofilum ochraceum]